MSSMTPGRSIKQVVQDAYRRVTQGHVLFGRGYEVFVVIAVAVVAYGATAVVRSIYRPQTRTEAPRSYRIASGKEVILVFVGSSRCAFCRDERTREAFQKAVSAIRAQTTAGGIRMSLVGVAVDWRPDSGANFLHQFADFDEVLTGRSWLNTGVNRFLRAANSPLVVPTVVLLERDLIVTENNVEVTTERVLATKVGLRDLLTWVDEGPTLVASVVSATRGKR